MSDVWFCLNYRENINKKYRIGVFRCDKDNNSLSIEVGIWEEEARKYRFNIRISFFWLLTNFNVSENHDSFLHSKGRKLIENLIRDMLSEVKIDGVRDRTIDFNKLSDEYKSKIFKNNNDELDYRRDPRLIALENKTARQIVLEQLFSLQNEAGGPVDRLLLKERCAYYPTTVANAIATLKSKGFIEECDGYSLTYSGSMYI